MIVHDFNIVNAIGFPDKTQPPLIVDANAVLAFAITSQRFKTIARRHALARKRCRAIQLLQLARRHAGDICKSLRPFTRK